MTDKEEVEDNVDDFSSADDDTPPDLETTNSTQTLEQFETLLTEVRSLKESGNMSFKKKDFETSITYYSQALGSYGKLEFGKDLPKIKREEAKKIFISIHGNLAAVYTMTKKWAKVIDHSTKGLDEVKTIDVTMERKLLTRRGVAKSRKNTLRGAKEDLQRAAKLLEIERSSGADSSLEKKLKKENKKIVKEIRSVMQRLKERLKGRKRNLKKMFSEGLYVDRKTEAEKKKQMEAKRELELRMKYETSPMAKHQTFEEFKKEELERQKKIKEENERKEKERQKRRRKEMQERRKREREMQKQRDEDLSSDEELKGLMKGYKTRSDGSKTSYFDREIDPETKRLLAQQSGPQKITVTSTNQENEEKTKRKKQKVKSEWNSGATWEERDVSDVAHDLLTRVLCDVKYKGASGEASVTDVDSVSGDASVCLIRGRERAVFDLKVKLSFSGTTAQGQHVSGILASDECSSLRDSESKSTQGFKLVGGASRKDPATMALVDSLSRRIASVIESEFSERLIE